MSMKGFTLIELLVVIAIIGFISTIAMVNLNSARQKAKVASVLASFKKLQAGAVLCHASNADLTADGSNRCLTEMGIGTIIDDDTEICGGATTDEIGRWPVLPDGWSYGVCHSDKSAGVFHYQAVQGTCLAECSEEQCL